jgi:hypothetical protein
MRGNKYKKISCPRSRIEKKVLCQHFTGKCDTGARKKNMGNDFVSAPRFYKAFLSLLHIEHKYHEEPSRPECFQPQNEQPETTVLSIVSTVTSGVEHILVWK